MEMNDSLSRDPLLAEVEKPFRLVPNFFVSTPTRRKSPKNCGISQGRHYLDEADVDQPAQDRSFFCLRP